MEIGSKEKALCGDEEQSNAIANVSNDTCMAKAMAIPT